MSNRAARPYQGRVDADPKGASVAGLDSNQRPLTVQSRGAPADRATGHHQSPRPESNRLPARYKLAALPGELQGHRVPGAIRTRTTDLLGIVTPATGLRGHGAATRCRTGPPALRGRGRKPCAAAWLAILASNQKNSGIRARRVCQIPLMAIGCGRCDSNAHAARFELARSAGCLHSRMVRRQGLEPRPRHRLRACRSTIELAARAVPGSRTPMICLEGKCLAVRPVRHGGSRRYRTFLLQVFGLALIRLS